MLRQLRTLGTLVPAAGVLFLSACGGAGPAKVADADGHSAEPNSAVKRPGDALSNVELQLGIAAAQQPAREPEPVVQAEPGFAFPPDASGQELVVRLSPAAQVKSPEIPTAGPLPRKLASSLWRPAAPLLPAVVAVERLAVKSALPKAPRPPAESIPFVMHTTTPDLPERAPLATGPLVSAPSPDVNIPPALAQVAQPLKERASLASPSQEASRQAALAATPAPRLEPAPFLRLTIPDPFENRKAGAFRATLPEAETPIMPAPQVPDP